MKINLDLPCVRSYEDYHEVTEVRDLLNNFIINPQKIKSREIGLDNLYGRYWAVYYIGVCPNLNEIKKMLKEKGVKYDRISC